MRAFLLTLLTLAVMTGYAVALGGRFSAAPGGADASGYLNSARLLTVGRLTTPLRVVPELADASVRMLQPLGFQADADSKQMAPTYPVGVPVHFALASAALGWWWGPACVEIGMALGAIALTFWLARRLGAGVPWALGGAAALAGCAVFIYSSVQPFSDTIATFWCTAAIIAALYARSGKSHAPVWCGIAFAVAVAVRPTNVLLAPALLVLLGSWERVVWAALGAAPYLAGLLLYNSHVYGGPLRTGYGDIRDILSLRYIGPSLRSYALLVRLFPVGIVGVIAAPWLVRREGRAELVGLLLWPAALLAFYSVYYFTGLDWSFLRFVAPAFPVLLAIGCVALDRLFSPSRTGASARAWAAAGAVAFVSVAANLSFRIPDARKHDAMYVRAGQWLRADAPRDAIVVSGLFSGMIYHDTDRPIWRWDFTSPAESRRYLDAFAKSGRPVVAVLGNAEWEQIRQRGFAGHWEHVADFGGAGAWRVTP